MRIMILLTLLCSLRAHAYFASPPPKMLRCEASLSPGLMALSQTGIVAREAIDDLRRRAGDTRTQDHLNHLAAELARPNTKGRVVRGMVFRGQQVRPAIEAFAHQTERLDGIYADLRRAQRTVRRVVEKAAGAVFVVPKIDLLFIHLPQLLMRDGWQAFHVPETVQLLAYAPVMVAGLALVATIEFVRAMHFDADPVALPRDLMRLADGHLSTPAIHTTEVDLRADVAQEIQTGGLRPETRASAYAELRRTWAGLFVKFMASQLRDEAILDSVGDLDHVTIDHVLFEDEGEPVWVVVARFARQPAKTPRPKPIRRKRRPSPPVGWPRPAWQSSRGA